MRKEPTQNPSSHTNLGSAWFQSIYEHAAIGIAITDLQGSFVKCNPAYTNMLGYTEDALRRLKISELLHPEDCVANMAQIRRLLTGEISDFEIENRYQRHDGTPVWVRKYVSCLPDENGLPAYLMALVTDITERKQTEAALTESNDRLKKVLEIETVGVMFWNLDTGCMTDANDTLLKLLGYSRRELEAGELTWQKLTPPEYFAVSLAEVKKFAVTGRVGPYEKEYFHKDGTRQWFVIAGSSLGNNTCVEFCVDISVRKQAEVELMHISANLLEAQKIAHVGSFEFIADTRSTIWSDEVFRIYGLNPKEPSPTYDQLLQHCIHPDDVATLDQTFMAATQYRTVFELEHRITRPDGAIRWVFSRALPYLDEQGHLKRYIGTVLDITDRKTIEQALKNSEQLWQFALEGPGDGLWDWNAQTNKVFYSNQWKTMLGYTADEIGDSLDEWDLRVHPDDKAAVYVEINKLFAREIPIYSSEHRILCKDGRYKWILDRGKVIDWSLDGKPLRVIGTHSDINARKEIEFELQKTRNQLEKSEQRFSLAMDAAEEGIWDWQIDTNQIYLSPGYASMLGYQPKQLPQQLNTWFNLLHPQDLESVVKFIREQLAEAGQFMLEYRLRASDGSYRWILNRGKVVEYDDDGIPKRAIGTHVDITDLRQARESAQAFAQAKSAFLANMSHEIRTPMNAIVGFCQLLQKRQLDDESRQFVEKIHSSGRVLLSLINDILDFSKIEAGQLTIELIPFSLHEMLDDIAAVMASLCHQKTLELVITPVSGIEGLIGDRNRIQQVLTNLVSNAIKFTQQGFVEVRIDVINQLLDKMWLRFTVRDSGIGIAEDKQSAVFTAFTQADQSTSRRFGGTGLGLSICKQLVELMGGTIALTSQPDQGSEFSFELPFTSVPDIPSFPAYSENLHLIIAEVNATARHALLQMTRSLGWRADVIDTADADWRRVISSCAKHNRYDVLLMDWPSASQDLLETERAIRTFSKVLGEQGKTPRIVVTIAACDHDKLLLDPVCPWVDAWIMKPVTLLSLYNSIKKGSSFNTATPNIHQDPVETAPRRLSGIRVLVADDNEFNRELAQRLLESEGCDVALVENGQEAYEWLKSHPDSIDIILMDVQMPVLDGYAATRCIHAEPCWQHLPIIALSAGAFKEDIEQALAAGMVDFLAKPLDVDKMIAKIQKQIAASADVQPASASHVDKKHDSDAPLPPTKSGDAYLDIDLHMRRRNWPDITRYIKYLEKFFDLYQSIGEEFRQLKTQGDLEQARQYAHKLRGGAGAIALNKIASHAMRLEMALKEGTFDDASMDGLQQAFDDAARCLDSLIRYRDIPNSLAELLTKLISALGQNDLPMAIAILIVLQDQVAEEWLQDMQCQLSQLEFRAAEQSAMALLHQLQPQ